MTFSPRERRASFWLTTALVALNLLLVNWIALSHFRRVDLTRDGLFTLHPATRELLAELDDLVTLRVYLSERIFKDHEAYAYIPREVRDWVTEFVSAADGQIVVEYFDPSDDEGVRRDATASGLSHVEITGQRGESQERFNVYCGMIASYGGKDQLIPFARADRIELDLAQAIVRLTQRETITIGFNRVTELPAGLGPGAAAQLGLRPDRYDIDRNLRLLRENLKQLYEIEAVPTNREVPPHIDVLVVVNTEGLDELHKFHIDQYLMQGGKVIFLADGVEVNPATGVPTARSGALDEFFDHYGFTVQKNLVLDTQHVNDARLPQLLPQNFDTTTNLMAGVPAFVLPLASSLQLNPPPGVNATVLARTSNLAWDQEGFFTPLNESVKAPTRLDEYEQLDMVAMLTGAFTTYFARRKLPEGVTSSSSGPTVGEFEEMRRRQSESKPESDDGSSGDAEPPQDGAKSDAENDPAGGDGGSAGYDDEDEDDESDEDEDFAGPPMRQGLFVRDKATPDSTVIVVGNALFLDQSYLGASGNLAFFSILVDRLTSTGRVSAIRQRTAAAPAIRADITPGQKAAIKYAGMLGMPLVVALAGVGVYLLRRRRRTAVEVRP